MSDDCIFCKIIVGQIPSTTIYEDEYFRAIMDISPANKGHVIVLAKKHVETIFDLDSETAIHGLPVVQKIAKAVQETLQCDGINILQNNGVAAGQTVYHYHIHIIPRYNNDKVTLKWDYLSYGEGEVVTLGKEIADKII